MADEISTDIDIPVASLVLAIFILLPVTWSTYISRPPSVCFGWPPCADIRPGRTDFRPAIHGHADRYVFFSQLGSFAGTRLGVFLDRAGSYDTIWWIGVLLGVIAAALHFPIDGKPVERVQTAGP